MNTALASPEGPHELTLEERRARQAAYARKSRAKLKARRDNIRAALAERGDR